MQDDDVANALASIKLNLDGMARDSERRFLAIESAVHHITDKVMQIETDASAIRGTANSANETSLRAMRKVSDSQHEIEHMGNAMKAHLFRIEQSIAEDARKAEDTRKSVAAGHDRMFEKQAAAIEALVEQHKVLHKATSSRGHMNTILVLVSCVLIPALTASAIQLMQSAADVGIITHQQDASR